MSEVKETKKTKLIAFRVTDDEYAQIERIALAVGEDPNNWCRVLTVSAAREGSGLTKTERLIYEEIARMRCPCWAWIQVAALGQSRWRPRPGGE